MSSLVSDTLLRTTPVRKKIETLSSTLSLPTARRALGVFEGEHPSSRLGGNDDPLSARDYAFEDEARLIDWKSSAKNGHPMVVDRERSVTSRVHLLMDNGIEMDGCTKSGETALQVAANAMCMFAALSTKRHDAISLVFGDSKNIIRKPLRGGLAQFERSIDEGIGERERSPRNFNALLDYARTLGDKGSLVIIATDDHALDVEQMHAIRLIAAMHPVILVDVVPLNPFRPIAFGQVTDGLDSRRIPAFMISEMNATAVDAHRQYVATQLADELKKSKATLIRAASSDEMFSEFLHLISAILRTPSLPTGSMMTRAGA